MLQLNPTIWMRTPKGVGLCHFVIDYGEEHDLLWVVADDATGELWTWPNPEVRLIPNKSMDAPRTPSPEEVDRFIANLKVKAEKRRRG